MALQDVCGSLGLPVGPEWFTPATLSMSLDDTSLHFGGGHFELGGLHATKGGTPLQFYVPVPEYLTESPIQFGQSVPSNAPCQSGSFQGPSPQSLPSFPPLSPSPSVPLPFPMSHGTTTLAFVFQGGVIAAADTRSSCSGLIACPASAKILPVHAHMVGTTSGTSADCMLWKRILSRECRLYQLRNRRRLSVGGTAKLLSHMLHPFKGTELCVAATLCGWDGEGGGAEEANLPSLQEVLPLPSKGQEDVGGEERGQSTSKERGGAEDGGSGAKRGVAVSEDRKDVAMGTENSAAVGMPHGDSGPRLCYVCSDGTLLKGELFSVGSGSPYAYSVLDDGLQWGLSLAEACSLAREAVYRATHRDAYSGNCVDLYHITARGWRRREREELREEYYREKERERWRVEERRREREKEREGQR